MTDPSLDRWKGDNPFIIQGSIRDTIIHQVYIDTGSSADVMYKHCFWLLPDAWKEGLRPVAGQLLVFILGRTTLLKFGATSSTIHGIVKFSTSQCPGTILATPPRELKCYKIMQLKDISMEVKRPKSDSSCEGEVINKEYPSQKVNVGTALPTATRQELIRLLQKYKHVFSWTPTDRVGVDRGIIEHKLMIKPGAKEVKQLKHVHGGDRNKAINVEVAKLTSVCILRKAIFPTWIINPVMVKKQDGSWRMCIDYSDLNKVCPKDCYLLPEINQKVESLHGF